MAVPKKKTSKSKRNMRRSHHALERIFSITCPQCGENKALHRACSSCGYYRGRQVIKVEANT
jgi:large subunit ribosomal protein L32